MKMNMEGLDDVFDEDLGLDEPVIEPTGHDDLKPLDIEDAPLFDDVKPVIVEELLKSKGINDSKVTIIDENDEPLEVDFYSLPVEEQIEILNYQEEVKPITEIPENLVSLSEQLNESGQSLEQFLESYKEAILAEIPEQVGETYEIDSYDNKELFLLDLKAKYDLTDDELQLELEKALENEELFNKKITKTREEYKQLEDNYKQEQADKFEADRKVQYDEFSNTMVDVAMNNSEYYGIELEDSEKNEVLGDLLELDENGTSAFYKDLADPAKLFEVAWFRRYGKDAFEALQTAYEEEIAKLKKDIKPKPAPAVVIGKSKKPGEQSIYDLNI